MKRIIKIFACFIIMIYILTVITNYSDYFPIRNFIVKSGSMEPTIDANDLVFTIKESKYEVKDIVTFKENKTYITHRIIDIIDDEITTKGDNNNTHDESKISQKNIVGKVFFIMPGFIYSLLQLLAYISIVLLIILCI